MAQKGIVDTINGDTLVTGSLIVTNRTIRASSTASMSGATGFVPRSAIAEDSLAEYPIPFTGMRRIINPNQFGSLLPTTADPAGSNTGDLGLSSDSWSSGGASSTLSSNVGTNDTMLSYAAFYFSLPPEYVAGGDVKMRVWAKPSVILPSETGGATSSQLSVHGGAVYVPDSSSLLSTTLDMHSPSVERYNFDVTSTVLSPGDQIRFQVATVCQDASATSTAIIYIYGVSIFLDIKG